MLKKRPIVNLSIKLWTNIVNMTKNRSYKKDESQEVENLTIRSVVPLTEAEKRQIIALFLKKIDRPLGEVNEIIDPDLVTGVSIQSESYYFEVSGRQQLSHMHDMFHAKS